MTPLELALKYMELFYKSGEPSLLEDILSKDLQFEGPLFSFKSAADYIQSLMDAPPEGMNYTLLATYQNERSVCLVYAFSKGDIQTQMVQVFEIRGEKICAIKLFFDKTAFLIQSGGPVQ